MAPAVKVRLEVEGTPEAIAAVKAFAAQSKAAGKEAGGSLSALGALGGPLSGATLAMGAVAAAAAVAAIKFGQFTLETVRLTAEQKDLALSLGTTVANMSAISAVAKATNTEQSKLVSGLGTLADRIKDLRQGAPDAVRAFAQLGLSAKDFTSDDVVENAAKVAERLERVARGGTRGAIAVDLLGKGGRALLPTFEKLNQLGGLEGATRFAKELGVFVDAKTVATFDAIASKLQEIEMWARGIALAFARGLGPDTLTAFNELQRILPNLRPEAEVLGMAIGLLARGFAELTVHTIAWGTVLGDVLTGQFAKARADFEKFDQILKDMKAAGPTVAAATNDAVGGGNAGGGRATADAAANAAKLLAIKRQYDAAEGELFDASARAQLAALELIYRQGLVGTEAYYNQRLKIATAALEREQKILERAAEDPKLSQEERLLAQRQSAILTQRIAAIVSENAAARGEAKSFGVELQTTLTRAFTDWATNGVNSIRSVGDAFRSLGLTAASALQSVAGKWLVSSLMGFLFPGAPQAHAAGGLITGPGTGTSDSIPAWVSNGEYILPASVVRQPGMMAQLEALRTGFPTPRLRPLGFATGGLVDVQPGGAAGARAAISGSVEIALGEGLVAAAIRTPAVQRELLKVVSRNPRAFGRALGR